MITTKDNLTVGQLMDKLSEFDKDLPVLISDGFKYNFYNKLGRASFDIFEENGKTFLDIGVGGCEDE